MNSYLFIGAINFNKIPLGGEEYKNQLLIEKFLEPQQRFSFLDTYHWNYKPYVWCRLFVYLFIFKFDKIIISASSLSTFRLLKLITFLKPSLLFKIHYFVIGGYFPEGIKSRKYKWQLYRNLRSVVVEGEMLKNRLLEYSELKNIKVIPNFKKFDMQNNFVKSKFSMFKFVYIGRISNAKGIREIIEAVKIIKSEHKDLKFEVDFYGPIEDHFHFLADEGVSYCGYLDVMSKPEESYQKLSEYSCMLFPTYWRGEGFPGVIIDAFIAGLPVIATDWNMNIELVRENETGLIVPIKNSRLLAKAMYNIIQNPLKLDKMRKNALKNAKKYNIDEVWPQILDII